jgi:hypothetical protein
VGSPDVVQECDGKDGNRTPDRLHRGCLFWRDHGSELLPECRTQPGAEQLLHLNSLPPATKLLCWTMACSNSQFSSCVRSHPAPGRSTRSAASRWVLPTSVAAEVFFPPGGPGDGSGASLRSRITPWSSR